MNAEAADLGLGSGGFDVVHCNLTRGLDGDGGEGHVMKLNYTSLQHAVQPLEEGSDEAPPAEGIPVAVLALHGQLPCAAFALTAQAPGVRAGYVQTPGGALPGELSDTVADMLERGMLAGHVSAGPAHGAPAEAITVEGALDAGRRLGWDCALGGPRPGDSRLGLRARPRRPGGAVERARGAGARIRGRAGATAFQRRPARSPPRPEPPHRHRAADVAAPRAGAGARGPLAPVECGAWSRDLARRA